MAARALGFKELDAQRFEQIHLALDAFNGSPTQALERLRQLSVGESAIVSLRNQIWDLETLTEIVRSREYRAWLKWQEELFTAHAQWAAYKILSDPKKLPPAELARLATQLARGNITETERDLKARVRRQDKDSTVVAQGAADMARDLGIDDAMNRALEDKKP